MEYDLTNGSLSSGTAVYQAPTGVTGAVFNPMDGLLYICDSRTNAIYTVSPISGVVEYYTNANVRGGDLGILDDGSLFLATQGGDALIMIDDMAPAEFTGSLPAKTTGLAASNTSLGFLVSNFGSQVFTEISAVDASVITAYNVLLNGQSFTLSFGDMAAGCAGGSDLSKNSKVSTKLSASRLDGSKSALAAWPNPAQDLSQIAFDTQQTGRTRVALYDLQGTEKAVLFEGETKAGERYNLAYDTSSLPNGVYIYRMLSGNGLITAKLIIQH